MARAGTVPATSTRWAGPATAALQWRDRAERARTTHAVRDALRRKHPMILQDLTRRLFGGPSLRSPWRFRRRELDAEAEAGAGSRGSGSKGSPAPRDDDPAVELPCSCAMHSPNFALGRRGRFRGDLSVAVWWGPMVAGAVVPAGRGFRRVSGSLVLARSAVAFEPCPVGQPRHLGEVPGESIDCAYRTFGRLFGRRRDGCACPDRGGSGRRAGFGYPGASSTRLRRRAHDPLRGES